MAIETIRLTRIAGTMAQNNPRLARPSYSSASLSPLKAEAMPKVRISAAQAKVKYSATRGDGPIAVVSSAELVKSAAIIGARAARISPCGATRVMAIKVR